MTQVFIIHGTLPGLNDYTKACRSNRHAGNSMKIKAQAAVLYGIHMGKLQPITGPVKVVFQWVEPNMRRDLDNIAFAKKFIFDALVAAGILQSDGWSHVTGFTDSFSIDKDKPRIEIIIEDI